MKNIFNTCMIFILLSVINSEAAHCSWWNFLSREKFSIDDDIRLKVISNTEYWDTDFVSSPENINIEGRSKSSYQKAIEFHRAFTYFMTPLPHFQGTLPSGIQLIDILVLDDPKKFGDRPRYIKLASTGLTKDELVKLVEIINHNIGEYLTQHASASSRIEAGAATTEIEKYFTKLMEQVHDWVPQIRGELRCSRLFQ